MSEKYFGLCIYVKKLPISKLNLLSMSKRRITSDIFEGFPSFFLKKAHANPDFINTNNERNNNFQTQEGPHRPILNTSKIIMNKINFSAIKTSTTSQQQKTSPKKTIDLSNEIPEFEENLENIPTHFNFNPQNILDFENFIKHSQTIPPSFFNLQHFFRFPEFNRVQTQCIYQLLFTNENLVISSPTGSGKTVLFELAILKLWQMAEKSSKFPIKSSNNFLNNSTSSKNFTIIYLSPIKALCQEKLQEWTDKFGSMGLIITELTGDSADIDTIDPLISANIIITTPEKWDSITRKWHDHELLLSKVSLILIDEVHLLNTEERGATLEAIISRMKLLSSRKTLLSALRIIALSATIPNIDDIALWLGVKSQFIKVFNEEYRPVPLEKHVLGYNRSKSEFLFEKSLNYRLLDIIRKFAEKKPTLVFCQTQKGTITACEQLIMDSHPREFVMNDEHLRILLENSSKVSDPHLKKFIFAGLAFHNARLKPEDRRVVEFLFKERLISVICTTSTLAQGVNLPARLVIIKSTVCYRGAGIGYSDYSLLEIEQMMGRAGRPQYDNKGVVVIMTEREKVEKFQRNFAMKEELESHFGKKIAEHLNAEVALGSVSTLQNAIDYVKSTFFYIRLRKNPELYRKNIGNCYKIDEKLDLDEYIAEICRKLLSEMQEYDLLYFETKSNFIKSLDLGVEMSRYYVEFLTIKRLFAEYHESNDNNSMEKILKTLSQANEYEKFRSKLEERGKLKILNEKNRFKIKGAISTYDKKTFVLLQSWIQRESIDDWELVRDTTEIINYYWRILSCFKKFFIKKKQANNLIHTLRLNKYIRCKTWNDNSSNILRQIPGIGEKLAKILIENKLDTFDKILKSNEGLLETYCSKNHPFGENIKQFIRRIPKINIKIKEKKEKTISFEVTNLHQGLFLYETNEISNTFLVFFNKSKSVFLFKTLYWKKEIGNHLEFDIHLGNNPNNLPLHIAVINERFVGFDKNYKLEKDLSFKEIEINEIHEQIDFVKKKNSKEKNNLNENTNILDNANEENEDFIVDELLQEFLEEKNQLNQKTIEKNPFYSENKENNSKEIIINNFDEFENKNKIVHRKEKNQKNKKNEMKVFYEKAKYQEFYSLFEDIF